MSEWVVVTGASSGIGKDVARRLAATGRKVIAGVRHQADYEIAEKNGTHPLFLDVSKADQVQAAAEKIRGLTHGAEKVHLVNNAGIAVSGPVEAVSMEKWTEQFEVNVLGLVRMTQAVLPLIRETQGRVVNVSSISGLFASPYLGPYCASKFAVEALSDSLRRELRPFGVRVILIEPGPVATPIWEKGLARKDQMLASIPEDLRRIYGKGLERFEKMTTDAAHSAVAVDRCSRVIERALAEPNPRLRYLVGKKSLSLQTTLFACLPAKWMDGLIARVMDR